MAAAASLSKSTISFRRQGSSGIVWGVDSTPGDFDFARSPFLASNSQQVNVKSPSSSSSTAAEAPEFFRSRSTGFLGSSRAHHMAYYVHGDHNKTTHKSRFNLGRWIKKLLSKTTH